MHRDVRHHDSGDVDHHKRIEEKGEMNMDYMILMLVGFFVITGGGLFIILRWLDSRFPKIRIMTRKKGTLGRRNYRRMGDVIVQDDIISLMLGNYFICGFLSWLDYSLEGGQRIYEGYLCRDFVLSINEHTTDARPVIEVTGNDEGSKVILKAKLSDELLLPVKYSNLNYDMVASDLQKGRDICGKFVTSLRQNQEYTNSTNPFIMMLLTVLPQLLLLGITFTGLYFILTMVFDRLDVLLAAVNALSGSA